jgi:hypothetical protein
LRNSYFPKFPENNIAADIKTFPAGVDYLSLGNVIPGISVFICHASRPP